MKVSVLICTYGSPQWEELAWSRAFPSAQSQGAHEVIVEHDAEMYLDEVRNAAAEEATGDWLCFLDADDELAPDYLRAMEVGWRIADPAWGERGSWLTWSWSPLLVPAVQYVQANGYATLTPRIPNHPGWPQMNECVIGTLIVRQVFLDLGGFRPLLSLEDYDLFLRAYDEGARLHYVTDAVYRAHLSSNSRNSDQGPYEQIWADHLERIAT